MVREMCIFVWCSMNSISWYNGLYYVKLSGSLWKLKETKEEEEEEEE